MCSALKEGVILSCHWLTFQSVFLVKVNMLLAHRSYMMYQLLLSLMNCCKTQSRSHVFLLWRFYYKTSQLSKKENALEASSAEILFNTSLFTEQPNTFSWVLKYSRAMYLVIISCILFVIKMLSTNPVKITKVT